MDGDVYIGSGGQGGSSQALYMGSTAGSNTISQSIPGLTANQVYTLCFYLQSNSSSGAGSLSVNWDGNVVLLQGSNAPFGYQYYSFEVLARGSGQDIVSFVEQNPPSFYLLDNVWLQTCTTGCSVGLSDQGATKVRPSE